MSGTRIAAAFSHRSSTADQQLLAELRPYRMVHNDCSPISHGVDRMSDTARHDRYESGPNDLRHSLDSQLQFALDHLINFFLRVKVFMNGRTTHEAVMGKRHVRGVKIASMPARQTLYFAETADVHNWHIQLFSSTTIRTLQDSLEGARLQAV